MRLALRLLISGLPMLLLSRVALAQPTEPGDAGSATTPSPEALTPPSLKTHPEASYPPEAMQQRVEGNVGLELTIDETGTVVDAKVISPAGHGFDEAAVAAAKQFTFEPARKGGSAIRSTVQFTYEFHLPPPPPAPPSPPPAAEPSPPAPTKGPEVVQASSDQSTLVLASRPISAASSSPCAIVTFNCALSAACKTSSA